MTCTDVRRMHGKVEMPAKPRNGRIVIGVLLAVLLVAIAVGLILHLRNVSVEQQIELETTQQEFVQELQDNEGRYDAQSIVLPHTSEPAARELAEKLGAKLRITKDGSFATLTLPEGVTILDVAMSEDYLSDLPSMSADYEARIFEVTEEDEEASDEKLPMRPQYSVSDTSFELQTYLDYLNLRNVWATTKGNGVTVAVIDTGIDTDHPEFAGRISEYSYNATEDKIVKDYVLENGEYDWSLVEDEQGHGTSVAGVIAASMNSGEIVGVAPEVTLIIIKAECDEEGNFKRGSDLAFGLYYAIERDASVVNMSFGGGYDKVFVEPVQLAYDSDVICVAAAGNDSTAWLTYPAAFPNVIGVGALADDSWELADYSNYGENVDVVAPGTTYSTAMGGGYKNTEGTSLACPAVAGAIALMCELNPYAEIKDVWEILYASCYDLGDLGHDWYYGYGAVDVSALILEERGTVTFNMMTDELDNTEQLFIRNHTLQTIPQPERLYSIFDGWYYDPQCTEEYNWYADEFSADLTLYASWVNEDDGIPYTYVILEDGTVEIRSYTGHRRFITIPDYIEGRIVSSIGVGAFAGETRLREVNLPKYLVRIREQAFYGCSNLISMNIPDTVTEIGEMAFMDNVRMSSVIFGENSQLQTIGAGAFAGLGRLKEITLPASLEIIEHAHNTIPGAFAWCNNLSTVTFAENSQLYTIGDLAFANCTNLKTITLPASLKTMDGSAFVGATAMQSFAVQTGSQNFSAIDGVLFDDTAELLVCYPASRTGSYDVPDSVVSVGDYAFACSALSNVALDGVRTLGEVSFAYSALISVSIPDSVTSMEIAVFSGCENLYEVHIGCGITEIPLSAFQSCSNLASVYIPANVQRIESSAFKSTEAMTTISFAEDSELVYIGSSAFYNSGIVGIRIPKAVEMIDSTAFGKNPLSVHLHYILSSVTFEEGSRLQFIGESVFSYNLALTEIELPVGLQTIGDFAFSPTGLQTVTLPQSLISLGIGAFARCDSLENIFVEQGNAVYHDVDGVVYDLGNTTLVEYPAGNPRTEYTILDGVTNVGQYAFCGSDILQYVTFPDSLITVEEYGFYDCQGTYWYSLNENLTYIERYAFSRNSSLQSMYIPDSVMQISYYAFAQDWNLASVTFNETAKVPRISFGAFAYCGLETFRVPPNVSTMAQKVFEGCSKLTSVTFAENSKLESISAYVFDGCDNLQSITFEAGSSLTSIQAHGFEGMCKLTTIDFGDAPLTNIDNFAFRFCESLTSLTIPEGVTNIGRFAFYYCSSLTEIVIPTSMEHIGRYAFIGTSDIDLYFVGESLPLYLDEDWDHGIKSYFLGVTDITVEGDWKYASLASGNIGIIDYTGTDADIDMTALDLGGDIVNIGGKVFYGAKQLKQITLPNTLHTIQAEAFYNSGLTEINIPSSVTFIGRAAFAYTPITSVTFGEDSQLMTIEQSAFEMTEKLNSVTIPGTVTNMGRAVFKSSGIASVTFGEGFAMTEIPEQAFAYTHLASVTIPDSVTLINHNAFRNISELESVTWGSGADLMLMSNAFYQSGLKTLHIPANMTYVGEYAFVALPNLTEFTVDENNPYYTAVDGLLIGQNGRKLIAVPAGRTGVLNVPVEIEIIGFGAFEDSGLSEINFHPNANILSFGYRAFYNARNITEIHVPASVVAIDFYAFANCSNLAKVTLAQGSGLNGVYEGAFLNCSKLSEIQLPDGIDEISDFAFYGCRKLTSIPVSETTELKGIYDYAMAYTGITGEFTTPETLVDIGPYAFLGTRVTKVTVPNTNYWDLVIGIGAFEDCNLLEEITVPFIGASFEDKNITWFGYIFGAGDYEANAAYIPESLKRVTISGEITKIYQGAFYQVATVEELVLPHSVTDIYRDAFEGTTAKYELTNVITAVGMQNYNRQEGYFGSGIVGEVELSDRMTCIGNGTFSYCYYLTGVTIPNSITSIGNSAFWDCRSLVSINIPDGVMSIGAYAFYGCSNLASITIPDGVTSIEPWAFASCRSLTSITIPNNVTSIGDGAFFACSGLRSITFPDTVTHIGDQAFMGVSISDVYITELTSWYNLYAPALGSSIDNLYLNGELISGDCGEYIDTVDGFRFTKENDIYTLIGYTGDKGIVTLPQNIDGQKYEIKWSGGASHIIIPEGITGIGGGAFAFCTDLKSISIPNSVTDIGDSAFAGCTGLESVEIPDGVINIGELAFNSCEALTDIIIPDSVESIGRAAFRGCTNMTSITIGGGVENFGDLVFTGCKNLRVTISPDNEHFTNIDGVVYNKYTTQITLVLDSVTELCIPRTVTSFDFSNNTTLQNVTFEEGSVLIRIGADAFQNCTSLTSITIPDGVQSIDSWAFSGCTGLTSITLPDSVTSIGYGTFSGCSNLTSITIPDSVTSIGPSAFEGCTGLTSITIPDSVTSLGSSVFEGCTSLTEITIPGSITVIPWNAFRDCSNLKTVVLCQGVTSIADGYNSGFDCKGAFADCTSLTSISFPESLESIGSYAFYRCTSLTNVTLLDGLTIIGDHSFYECTGLTNITLPDSVTIIDAGAFWNCRNLTNVILPDGLTSIGEYAFNNCERLTSVILPDSLTSIGNYAFDGCTGLTNIAFPNNVINIGVRAFSCETYQVSPNHPIYISYDGIIYSKDDMSIVAVPDRLNGNITIPEGVTCISGGAFDGCTGMTSITISDSVISIGGYAFYDCTSLTSITIPNSVTSIGDGAFQFCENLYVVTNHSDLPLTIGSTDYGLIAYYAKIIIDKDGNTTYRDEAPGFEYIDTADGFRFMKENDIYTLLAYLGEAETVTLPRFINGHEYAINWKGGASHLILPEGMTSIDSWAFAHCTGLSSITIPDSMTSIGEYAFYCCTNLTSIKIGDGVTSIGEYAFFDTAYCNDEANWEQNALYIGKCLIRVRAEAKYYPIHDDTVCWADDAFSGCYKLKVASIGGDYDLISPILSPLVNLETLIITEMPFKIISYWGSLVSDLPITLKNIVLAEEVRMSTSAFYDYIGDPITGRNIFVVGTVQDTMWDENFIGWQAGNKVYYGDKWSWVTFCDDAGNTIAQNLVTNAQMVRQQFAEDYTDDKYLYRFQGYDINGDGVADTIPAQTMVDIRAVEVYEREYRCVTEGHLFGQWSIVLEATCLNAGKRVHYCEYCGLDEHESIDALGHKYTTIISDPTCTDQGYTTYICHCGDSYVDDYVDANGHSYGAWYTTAEPTCITTGMKDHSCEICGYYEEQSIAALGHNPATEWTEDLAPTCTTVGSKSHHCTRCDEKLDITEIPANGHTPADAVEENHVDSTCTAIGGYDMAVYCTVCGAEMSRDHYDIEALGHDMGEWYQTIAPTCTTEGENKRDCSRCDHFETEVVPANGHSPADVVVENRIEPTCTDIGGYDNVLYCTVCGAELSREHIEISAIGHTPADAVEENHVDSTCTEIGGYDMVAYCSVCDEELSREHHDIDALGHAPATEWTEDVASTCTTVGSKSHHCTRCDEKLDITEIPANGHSHTGVVTDPACTSKGFTTFYCHCGDNYFGDWVDALGHTEAIDTAVDPTCTATGLTEGKHCSVCNAVLVAQEVVPANGHTYESVVTAPTCTEKGYTTHTCHCGDSYVDSEVDALGHTPSDWIVDAEPQIGVEGSKHKECTVCGETLKTEVIEALTEAPSTEVPTSENKSSGNCNGVIGMPVVLIALLGCIATAWRPRKRG